MCAEPETSGGETKRDSCAAVDQKTKETTERAERAERADPTGGSGETAERAESPGSDPTAGAEGTGEARMQEEGEQDGEEREGEEQDGDGVTTMDGEGETATVNGREREREAGAREMSGGKDGGEREVKRERVGGLGTSEEAEEVQSGMEWEASETSLSEGDVMEKVGEVRKRTQTTRKSKRLGQMKKKAAR
ncbi:uncharacterized protein ACO6RY_18728 [Pungitius sinensis]